MHTPLFQEASFKESCSRTRHDDASSGAGHQASRRQARISVRRRGPPDDRGPPSGDPIVSAAQPRASRQRIAAQTGHRDGFDILKYRARNLAELTISFEMKSIRISRWSAR
jgi:hypothetical protein